MASSEDGTPPKLASGGQFENNDDDDEDDDAVVANVENLDDQSTTSQDNRTLRPLPVMGTRGYTQQERQSPASDAGRSRRAALMTQYLGKHYPSISVVEEEGITDDDPDDDDVIGDSGAGTTTVTVDDGVPHYAVECPQNARMRYQRVSLLGKPRSYRSSRRETRIKRLQSRVYNFLERPKTCPSISYHTAV